MLDDAITLLPQAKLRKLIRPYLNPNGLRRDGEKKGSLLSEIQAFKQASSAGVYYQAFEVNSKNYTEKSLGTLAWIADCRRLLGRCVAHAVAGNAAETRQAFEIMFGLLNHIDEGEDDVIFFADEGGSWQVGIDWEKVLPAWFRVLSATAEPAEYAQRIAAVLEHHCRYKCVKLLAVAKRMATPVQRLALPDGEEQLVQIAETYAIEKRHEAVERRAAEDAATRRTVRHRRILLSMRMSYAQI